LSPVFCAEAVGKENIFKWESFAYDAALNDSRSAHATACPTSPR
jgi:hypothetical protein